MSLVIPHHLRIMPARRPRESEALQHQHRMARPDLAQQRRYQRLPNVLEPELAALLREVGAGHPVQVLQNRGLSWAPRWHYAVVVGYDLARDEVVLRSGTERRHRVSFK